MSDYGSTDSSFMKDFNAAWLVAGVVAVWGVFISLDSFWLANASLIVAALISFYKAAAETHLRSHQRKIGLFVAAALSIAILLFLGIWFSHHREHIKDEQDRISSEKDRKIENLSARVERLQGLPQEIVNLQEIGKSQADKADQKIDDLAKQNGQLESAIAKKDQALVDIANRELSLKFEPRITIETRGSKDTLYVENMGSANVILVRLTYQNMNPIDLYGQPNPIKDALIAPNAWTFTQLDETALRNILSGAAGRPDFSYQGTATIRTGDNKLYELPFTWEFIIKNGEIASSIAKDGAITEVHS
jgi:hypothetical protein